MRNNIDNKKKKQQTEYDIVNKEWEQLQQSRGMKKTSIFAQIGPQKNISQTNQVTKYLPRHIRSIKEYKLYFEPKIPMFLKDTHFDPYYISEEANDEGPNYKISTLFKDYYRNGSLLLSYYREKIQNNKFIDHYSSVHATYFDPAPSRNSIFNVNKDLPIYKMEHKIISGLIKNQVVIVRGQTGSGKTTLIPQIVRDMFNGTIVCTQPRRVAAISIAEYVAFQRKTTVGDEVGYTVRFDNKSTNKTKIKYVTEGILLKEFMSDRNLSNYTHVMVDEAHERTLNTDLILGMLKLLINTRKDLRIIIASATLDSAAFINFFGSPSVLDIPGNLYDVKVSYQNILSNKLPDYLEEIYKKIMSLHLSAEKGDILVFVPGAEEIEALCQLCFNTIKANGYEPIVLLPLYSILAPKKQKLVFESFKVRKCVISTNIAETSLTVPGIKFVIDCGFSKIKQFIPRLGVEVLITNPISKQSAVQRAGRAGRLEHGCCFRIYDEKVYGNMDSCITPEVLRSNLSSVVLRIFGLGIDNFWDFNFINEIKKELIFEALYRLYTIRALDSNGNLTNNGEIINSIPFDPNLARMIVYSAKYGLLNDTIAICSMLSVNNNVFIRDMMCGEAESKLEGFKCVYSDHITLLNIFQHYMKTPDQEKFCNDICVNKKTMERATDIYNQVSRNLKNKLISKQLKTKYHREEALRKIVASGSLHTLSVARKIRVFENLRSLIEAKLHPTSSLYCAGHDIKAIVYNDLVVGKNTFINIATAVDLEWIKELAPEMYSCYE